MPGGRRSQCALGQRGGTRAGQASGLSCFMGNGRGDLSHTEPTSRRQPQFRTWDMFSWASAGSSNEWHDGKETADQNPGALGRINARRQAHDTANTISDSPANDAANTNTGCSTTAPYYGVGDSHIL